MEARTAISPDGEARPLDHPWLGAILDALDGRLRLRHGVIEYTRCPNCLFRIQVIQNYDDFVLSDGVHVRPGDRLISLHVWNEQFPTFPAPGPTLAWARRINRAFDMSLRDLAHFSRGATGPRRRNGHLLLICSVATTFLVGSRPSG